MDIKATLSSSLLASPLTCNVSPQWLLEHDEDDLLIRLRCSKCQYNFITESGEPNCYGECIDMLVDAGYAITYNG